MKEIKKECTPCRDIVSPLKGSAVTAFAHKLPQGWKVVEDHHLEKTFKFSDFRNALKFTNQIGELAEREGHHPDILLSWGQVKVTIWTHKIDGLSENDFLLAARIESLPRP